MWLQTPPQRRSRLTETTYPRLSCLHLTETNSPWLSYSLLASEADRFPTFLAFLSSSFIPHIPAVSTPSPVYQAPSGHEKGTLRTRGTERLVRSYWWWSSLWAAGNQVTGRNGVWSRLLTSKAAIRSARPVRSCCSWCPFLSCSCLGQRERDLQLKSVNCA